MERLLLVFLLLWTTSLAVEDFCRRGFQVATRYHDCWQQAKFANKYPDLYERHEFLDKIFLEKYATFMCSVIKPKALECFKKDIRDCPNSAKLIELADESGGACKGKELNPFFKTHVINHLVPVTGDRESPCFTVGDSAYDTCYIAAGKKIIDSGKTDEIERFHYVADMFFETYWDCLIGLYKANAKECPNWQIPMLLVLQKTALPSLFGMHLRPNQVYKLELQTTTPLGITQTNQTGANETETDTDCQTVDKDKKLYLVMQLLTEKPSVTSGGHNLVLEISNLHGDKPEIALEGAKTDNDIMNFVNILSGPNTEFQLKERRRLRKQEKKKKKQLANLSDKIKGKKPTSNKKTKKTRKVKNTKNTKNTKKSKNGKKPQKDFRDNMIN